MKNFLITILTKEADNGNTPSNALYAFLQTKNKSYKSKHECYGFGGAFFPPRGRIDVIKRAFEINDQEKTVKVKDADALNELANAYKDGDPLLHIRQNIKKYTVCLVLLSVSNLINEERREVINATLLDLLDVLIFYPDDLTAMKSIIQTRPVITSPHHDHLADSLNIESYTPISTGHKLKERKPSGSGSESPTPTTTNSESSKESPGIPTIQITIMGEQGNAQLQPPLSPLYPHSSFLTGGHSPTPSPTNQFPADEHQKKIIIVDVNTPDNEHKTEISTVREESSSSPSPGGTTPNQSPFGIERSLREEDTKPDNRRKELLIVTLEEHQPSEEHPPSEDHPPSRDDSVSSITNILNHMKSEGFRTSSIKLRKDSQYDYFTREIKNLSLDQLEDLLKNYMKTRYFNDVREETYFYSGRGNTRTWQNMCHAIKINILARLELQFHLPPSVEGSAEAKKQKRPMTAEEYDKYYNLLNKHSDRLYFHFGVKTDSATLFTEKFERVNSDSRRLDI